MQNAHSDAITSVDVETYHILTGMHSGGKTPFKILPGIFTSDVIGEHPLTDKIDPSNAWPYLTHVIQECFDYVKKTYTPTT